MADARTIILEYICPGIGVVLATQMFLAPYKDVQKAIRSGSLGELNPLPWVFMLGVSSNE
jgi:solute carrier family 50 protein (sugar transporter)